MSVKAKKAVNDPSRFEGEGLSYKAKLIGIEDVKDARGDQMCQEAIAKLKTAARIAGGHKRKIIVNINIEGLKITDAISLVVLHSHAITQISFIARDPADSRAFGYIYGTNDGLHKFFAIKTGTAAEQLVLAMKDLFQVVFDLKKKEEDALKAKQEADGAGDGSQIVADGSPTGDAEVCSPIASPDTEISNQDTTDSAAFSSSTKDTVQAEPVTNLLDLEDMADNILKGIEKVNTLEFDFLTSDTPSSSSSFSDAASPPATKVTTTPTATFDPWGLSVVETETKSNASSSALEDLAGLQSGLFSTNFSMQTGFGGSSSFNPLSVNSNPFGSDPFGSMSKNQTAPSFVVSNPFGSEFNQPFGTQAMPQRMPQPGAYGLMPGIVPHGNMSSINMGIINNPMFNEGLKAGNPFFLEDSTAPQTGKKDSESSLDKTRAKTPDNDLFGDLLDIKKSGANAAKSPKDLFVNAAEKKSMISMMSSGASPRASPIPTILKQPEIPSRASPVPNIFIQPEIPSRGSPVSNIFLQPENSTRASPVPNLPGSSPRASPIPTISLQPEVPSRASPVGSALLVPVSPRGSPFLTVSNTPTESVSFDPFGAAFDQISDKSLFD